MTSFGLIFKLLIGIWIAAIFGVIESGTAWAFSISFIIMDFMGSFNKDKAYLKGELEAKYGGGSDDEGLTDRQAEFKRKFEEGKRATMAPAVIAYTDNHGDHHKIVITADGDVETEGNPDMQIVEAAKNIGKGIAIGAVTPEEIAEEFERQIKQYYAEKDDERGND